MKLIRSSVTLDKLSESNVPVVLFLCLGLGIILPLWRTWWRLRHIPGPFPASITNLQRMRWVETKRAHLILQQMHDKYGELVRIGPNMVSFCNPEAIPTIYPMRSGFPKGRAWVFCHGGEGEVKLTVGVSGTGRILCNSPAIHERWWRFTRCLQHHRRKAA